MNKNSQSFSKLQRNPASQIQIDPEFKSLVPPLSAEELRQLEDNLKADGCRDPLVTWNARIIDGHNRFEICNRLGIEFGVIGHEFPDRDAAKVWIIRNQFGRRNLTAFQRSELVLKLEPLVARRAKENQRLGGKGSQKSVNHAADTQKELAAMAGVSHDTIHKTKVIVERAPEPVQEKLRRGETSINAAYAGIPKKGSRKGSQTASITDKVGHCITDMRILEVFQQRPEFETLMREISALKGEFQSLAGGPAGIYASGQLQQFKSDVDALHAAVRFCLPYAICPYCGGAKCGQCKQSGWMPEDIYKAAPANVKGASHAA